MTNPQFNTPPMQPIPALKRKNPFTVTLIFAQVMLIIGAVGFAFCLITALDATGFGSDLYFLILGVATLIELLSAILWAIAKIGESLFLRNLI
ncbi:hypothetical protein [Corynebacterium sp. H78]|uniref:hypothetical protein n=1 Tax=Corynebacterium sp. H78 TaxID=3133417 RepID=UPI003096F590